MSSLVAPERPVGPIRFFDVEATKLRMEWLPPRDDGGSKITAYKVEKSTTGNQWEEVTITEGNVTSIKVKDLKEEKIWFRVTAFNKVGCSKPLASDSVFPEVKRSKYIFIYKKIKLNMCITTLYYINLFWLAHFPLFFDDTWTFLHVHIFL